MYPEVERGSMPVKPSENEEEYFVRQQAELKRRLATEHQAKLKIEERERERSLHHMKCPKCGMSLEEIAFGEVRVDKCFHCEGLWLDSGELDKLNGKEPGFCAKLLSLFQP